MCKHYYRNLEFFNIIELNNIPEYDYICFYTLLITLYMDAARSINFILIIVISIEHVKQLLLRCYQASFMPCKCFLSDNG